MGPRPFGRGRRANADDDDAFAIASMGPRPFGRGRYVRPNRMVMNPLRFNGAATFRSRKVHPRVSAPLRWTGFNGAATFRSRKGYSHRT